LQAPGDLTCQGNDDTDGHVCQDLDQSYPGKRFLFVKTLSLCRDILILYQYVTCMHVLHSCAFLPCDQKDNQFRLEAASLQKPGRIRWNETFNSSQCSDLEPREFVLQRSKMQIKRSQKIKMKRVKIL